MENPWKLSGHGHLSIEELARGRSLSAEETATGAKAQLLGAAPYPGPRKTPVFFVGGFLAENRRAWEIISRSFQPRVGELFLGGLGGFAWVLGGFGWIFHEFS